MKIDILASPEMTGEWEHKLKLMEQGKLSRPKFMEEIRDLTSNVVAAAKAYAEEELNREYPPFPVPCPVCGAAELGQDAGRYKCVEPECNFNLSKVIASRGLSEDEAKQLLTTKHIGPLTGFLSRFKKPFDAAIVLNEDKKNGLKAGFIFEKSEAEEAEVEAVKEAMKSGEPMCKCPVCDKGQIYETPTSYVCNERVLGDGCKGRLSKEMCKYEIPADQALKFFTEESTDLIDKFISKKGRPFSAKLACNPKGTRILNWQFPPRKKKVPAKKASAKKKSAEEAVAEKEE